MNSLDIKNVWKCHISSNKEKVTVLKGISLQVKKGEIVAIMGPSGSGKSTLLNIISGVDCFDKGMVSIENKKLLDMNKGEIAVFRRRRLGMVFQDYNLIESLSMKENILLPMILDKRSEEEQENQVERLLKILDIEDIQTKNITEVSGGQKQRVAICRALINSPAIILADEPTGNLDTKATRDVMKYFTAINNELGTSILMVTHDVFAASYCNKVILLKDGKFAAEVERNGSQKEFLDTVTEMLTLIGGEQYDVI